MDQEVSSLVVFSGLIMTAFLFLYVVALVSTILMVKDVSKSSVVN